MKESTISFAAVTVLPVPVLVVSADQQKRVLACSKAFVPLCRFTSDSIIGISFASICFEGGPESIQIFDSPGEQEDSSPVVVLENKEGESQRFLMNINPIHDSGSTIDYFVCYFQPCDIEEYPKYRNLAPKFPRLSGSPCQLLREPERVLQALLTSVQGIIWEADAATFKSLFISAHVRDILGYTQEQWNAQPDFWMEHLHPADKQNVVDSILQALESEDRFALNYRIRAADGRLIWIQDLVTITRQNNVPVALQGVMIDISGSKRLEELNRLEREILELNAKGEGTILEIINNYMIGVEHIYSNMHCSLHQVVDNKLKNGIAPSLPKAYLLEVDGLTVGPMVGSCGTAVYEKSRIIVKDIANDPRWDGYKDIPLKYGLRACWSNPVQNRQGKVMAVFGIYYSEVKLPSEEELMVIERCTELFRIILDDLNKTKRLEESDSLMKQVQEMAQFGNWQWDMTRNVVIWSDELYRIYGLSEDKFEATFEAYQALLHPDDSERVMEHIKYVIHWKRDGMFEERIVRPDGEVRYLKSWCRVVLDDKGKSVGLFGACLDITDNKLTQRQLQASEARLRNLVDSQTNYVVRMGLDGKCSYYNNKYFEDYGWVYESGDIIGENPMAIVMPEYDKVIVESVKRCMESPFSVVSAELSTRSRLGGVRASFWHFKAILNDDAIPVEIQCIGVDITERKLAEDSLRSIAYLQSHVIRAPLARLMGIVDLMKNYENSEFENDELMQYLLESAQELDGIIKQISEKTTV